MPACRREDQREIAPPPCPIRPGIAPSSGGVAAAGAQITFPNSVGIDPTRPIEC
jgi:hypothetical protein